jgi:predicted Ser/Thr protein kinase/tetratricopeptide (TPR) repeat protein
MDRERYQRLRAAFAEVCDAPTREREARLPELCDEDPQLMAELRALLDEADAPRVDLERAPSPLIELTRGDRDGDGAAFRTFLGRAASYRDEAASCPASIGPYHVLDVLGEGGAGIVYRCRQARPRREVAVKVLRHATPRMRRRFELEMEVLGRLEHPGIARVLEGGVHGGEPYIAMELVTGTRLDRWAEEHDVDTGGRVALVEQACEAVRHAHRHGVVHRDLKPGNILVTGDGRVKVLDFGVARVLDDVDAKAITASGMMLGTPAYMSPEQVAGDPLLVDTRSDVYALGVVAFELLTGRLPYDVPDTAPPSRMLTAVAAGPDRRAGAMDRALRGDLETILGRAMALDPERRYPSADALAADLSRWRRGEPIEARRDSVAYLMRRRLARSRGIVAVAMLGVAMSTGFALHARDQAQRAEYEATQATAARGEAERSARAAVAGRDEAARQRDEAQAVTDFLVQIFGMADPDVSRSADRSTGELLEMAAVAAGPTFAGRPRAEVTVRAAIGRALFGLGHVESARTELLRALALHEGGAGTGTMPTPPRLGAGDGTGDAMSAADTAIRHEIRWPLLHAMEDLDDDRRWMHIDAAAADVRRLLAPHAPRLAAALGDLHRQPPADVAAMPDAAMLPVLAAAALELSPPDAAEVAAAGAAAIAVPADPWTLLGDHLLLTTMRLGRPAGTAAAIAALGDQAVRVYERVLPATNTRITRAEEHRLRAMIGAEGPEAAERAASSLLRRLEPILGPDHWYLGVIHHRRAEALRRAGRLAEAEAAHRTSLRLQSSRDPASKQVITGHDRLVRTLIALDRPGEAEAVRSEMIRAIASSALPQSVARTRVAFGSRHPELTRAILELYRALVADDEPAARDAAARLVAERRTLDPRSPEAGIAADFQTVWIATFLARWGADDDSRRFIEDAAAIAAVNPWRHPRKQADTWWWLAAHRLAEGRPGEAIDAAEQALARLESMDMRREDLEHRARALLGRAWNEAGDPARARPLLRDATAGLLRTRGRADGDTLRVLHQHLALEDRDGDAATLGAAIEWLLVRRIEASSRPDLLLPSAWRAVRRPDLPARSVDVARAAAELAWRTDPAHPDVARTLAAARLRAGDVAGAAALLPSLLERPSPPPSSLAVAALVEAAVGGTDAARELAARFLTAAADPAGAVDPLDVRSLTESLRTAGLID